MLNQFLPFLYKKKLKLINDYNYKNQINLCFFYPNILTENAKRDRHNGKSYEF